MHNLNKQLGIYIEGVGGGGGVDSSSFSYKITNAPSKYAIKIKKQIKSVYQQQ